MYSYMYANTGTFFHSAFLVVFKFNFQIGFKVAFDSEDMIFVCQVLIDISSYIQKNTVKAAFLCIAS